MIDFFLRAETPATYIDWLTKPQVRAIIGDLRARDDDGNVTVPAALRGIPGNVDLVQWQENQIVESSGVIDPQAWIHVRLTGDAETDDFAGRPDPSNTDRWEHSRMVNLFSNIGAASMYRGVTTFENVAGNGKGISILRGSEMAGAGVAFHKYMGGNRY